MTTLKRQETANIQSGSQSGRWLANWLMRYCRITRLECQGRLYEAIGIRSFFVIIARLFGDPLLPSCDDLAEVDLANNQQLKKLLTSSRLYRDGCIKTPALSLEVVRHIRIRSRYHEVMNLIACVIYVFLLVFLGIYWNLGLVVYAGILVSIHIASIFLERYKRALCETYITVFDRSGIRERAQQCAVDVRLTALEVAPPPAWLSGKAVEKLFKSRSYETETFYRAIGIEGFRRFVLLLTRLTLLEPSSHAKEVRFLSGMTPESLTLFDRQTRASELTHFVGALLHVPFLLYFVQIQAYDALAFVVFMLYLNIYAMLMQRYHRVRMWRILQKRRVRM